MQLAYSVKLSSGCISRQVGAVITDKKYSVKAVGWNCVAEGQVPCLLRDAEKLLEGGDEETYSLYERTDPRFRDVLETTYEQVVSHKSEEILCGRGVAYCFKDLKNHVDGEKNQVHTRSLHAEENAFLQITKYGGEPIEGGFLFTTASPCELCSKKAVQIGIKKIYYIDPYPGISNTHILMIGKIKPELILFKGAVGRAYHQLYQPILPYKDELRLLASITISGGPINKTEQLERKIQELEEANNSLESENGELKGRLSEGTSGTN